MAPLDRNLKIRKLVRISESHLAPIQDKLLSMYGIRSTISVDYSRPMLNKVRCESTLKVLKSLMDLHCDTIKYILNKKVVTILFSH